MRELPSEGKSLRDIIFSINQLIRGRSNAVGRIVLTPSATSTTITKATFNENAEVFLFPRTASARTAAPNVFASVTSATTVTITHASNAATDQSFAYLVIGG